MKKSISVAAIASVLMIAVLQWQGAGLKTAISPRGIIDLEFADNPGRLNELLFGWNILVVKGNIWLDFLFIVSYVLFLSVAAELCALPWKSGIFREAGFVLARLAYVAGVLDIAENLLMLQSIAGNFNKYSLHLTFYCAGGKFILTGIIVLYLLLSLPVVLRKNKI